MSLVHDALEKAKREAAAKSARELGLAESRVGAGQPFRARRRIHPAAAAVGAAAVTLGVVGAIYLIGSSETRSATPPSASAAAGAPPRPIPAPAGSSPGVDAVPTPTAPTNESVAALETPPSTPATRGNAPASTPAPRATESASLARGSAAETASPESPAPPPPAPAAATPTPAARVASHVRQVVLADGTVVRLGGIAWSQEAPLAYLNGKLYARGESVAGLLIDRIEKERVVLIGANGRIEIKLK